jgi:deoxyribonuclease V
LAIHLGAVLDLPTVGVTHRPLIAEGTWPEPALGSTSALRVGDEVPACWVRTIEAGRPLVIHAGWRTSLETARRVVALAGGGHRTPEPIREARRLARTARHAAGGGT